MGKGTATRVLRQRTGWVAAFVATALVGIPISVAGAAPRTISVTTFVNTQVQTGPGCTSPFNLCFSGTIRGTLNGTIEGTVTNAVPSTTPGVLYASALVTIHDIRGELRCTEDFAYNTTPGGPGEFGAICRPTGGTGRWTGASGYLHGHGTVNNGTTTATLVGKITLP